MAINESTVLNPMSVSVMPVKGKISRAKAITAITVGNGLEFFEFTSYSFFAIIIGKLYFPAEGEFAQLLMIAATFGIGFIARPVGGLILGLYADRVGRKAAMTLTLTLMAIGSGLIVIAPTYTYIGIAAPMMIVLARLLQGFALCGEMGASTSLLMEYADNNSRGFYGGFQLLSQNLSALCGALMGLGLTTYLTTEALESWGWRVPFAIGLLMGPLGVFIRRNLDETLQHSKQEKIVQPSVRTIFSEHWRAILTGICVVSGGTAGVYISMYYMPTYAKILHLPMSSGLMASCVAAAVASIFAPISGIAADRFGRKRMLAIGGILLIVGVYPAFLIITTYSALPVFLLTVGILSMVTMFIAVPMVVILPEMFPHNIRATGISIVYCISVSVFGGFAPFISTLLIQQSGSNLAPSWYLLFCCALTLLAIPFVPEKSGQPLD
ncbi:MAG: MFS transporter [Glaciimonas sp.]|nr:MFS transporter [Glaciimonas sp.]